MIFKRDGRRDLGRRGEEIAARHLRKQGLRILERNFRCAVGEIDIIAEQDDELVFVEVKTRRSDTYGEPALSVDTNKQRKIARVALAYISMKGLEDRNGRFDVISVLLKGGRTTVEHIEHAFALHHDSW